MQLIVRAPRRYHVSQDTVEEFEAAILSDDRVVPAAATPVIDSAIAGAARLIARAGASPGRLLRARRASSGAQDDFLAVMMDLDFSRIAPWFARSARKSIYLFDAWPSRHAAIRDLIESWGIQYAFVSSSEAAMRLATISDHCTFIWVPEGVDPLRYQQRSPLERDIDVIQLGRRYDEHHAIIARVLAAAGKQYVHERTKGEIVFPSRKDFIAGLARARVSVCVPSSVTHPERAGDVETMTTRYLQSMASKCLVLGHAPREMIEIFGYNPVVEIEMPRAGDQVLEVLSDYEAYLPLVERNYEAVIESHTWARRWERMSDVLFGARAPGSQPA